MNTESTVDNQNGAPNCNHPEAERTPLSSGRGYLCEACKKVVRTHQEDSESTTEQGSESPIPSTELVLALAQAQAGETAIVKPEPATLAGPVARIAVPMIDGQRAVQMLEAMNDTQVVAVAKASDKLTDFALAELRSRFYANGKIEGYESCKTWGAVLNELGIPERTSRHRIARSGVENLAKKHDGSAKRRIKKSTRRTANHVLEQRHETTVAQVEGHEKEPVTTVSSKLPTHKTPTDDESRYDKAVRELEELGHFGITSWHEFDIEHALEVRNIDATAENVAAIRRHPRMSEMEERIRAAGWDLIWTMIDELRPEGAKSERPLAGQRRPTVKRSLTRTSPHAGEPEACLSLVCDCKRRMNVRKRNR